MNELFSDFIGNYQVAELTEEYQSEFVLRLSRLIKVPRMN
jgi:hypothetical protein